MRSLSAEAYAKALHDLREAVETAIASVPRGVKEQAILDAITEAIHNELEIHAPMYTGK